MKMIDYHIHTKFCKHAEGEPEEYCEYALKNGIEEIGFSDHFPINYQPEYSCDVKKITMREDEIEEYLLVVSELNSKIKELKVRMGFEIDYYIRENLFFEKYSKDLYDKLDYTVCSIHFIEEFGVDQEEYITDIKDYGTEKLWEAYFNSLIAAIRGHSEYIDIIGHIDLPKKFLGQVPDGLFDMVREVLKIVRQNELVVEINTAGRDWPIEEQYPSEKVIDSICEQNIEITIGSDAHKPAQVGRYFSETIDLLKARGFTKLIKFDRHNKEYCYL